MFWKWVSVILMLGLTLEEVSAFGANNETWCCESGFCCDNTLQDCCGSTGHETCCQEGYQCCMRQCVVPTCVCCEDGCFPQDYQCCDGGGACPVGSVCCPAGCCTAGSTCCDSWGCCGVGFYCCGLGCCNDSGDPFKAIPRQHHSNPRMYI